MEKAEGRVGVPWCSAESAEVGVGVGVRVGESWVGQCGMGQ